MIIVVGIAVSGFFKAHGQGQFFLVQNIIGDEKITLVWVFVPISATSHQKTKMAADFRPKIRF